MTSSMLLLAKASATVTGVAVVGGGSYVVYQNSDSIKNIFVNGSSSQNNQPNNTPAGITTQLTKFTTNLFVVRYKAEKDTGNKTIAPDSSLTCTFDSETPIPCKIYQFGSATKLDNEIKSGDPATLIPVTTIDTVFVENSHLVVELIDTKKAPTDLQNKTITLKQDTTTLGKFDFDQPLIGNTPTTSSDMHALEESYIVKKSTDWNASNTTGTTPYRCKFSGGSGKSENYDSTCKLIKLATTGSESVIDFEAFKALSNPITATTLSTDTATDSYYKLTVNKGLLYNLDFDGTSKTEVQVELFKDTATLVGKLDIQQKLSAQKFVGKTSLILAKAKAATATPLGELSNAKCNFSTENNVVVENQFGCTLTKVTSGNTATKNFVFGTSALTTSGAIAQDDYFVIALTPDKSISDFDEKTSIFYQISNASTANTAIDKNIELEIVSLMSGEVTSGKKAIFLQTPLNK